MSLTYNKNTFILKITYKGHTINMQISYEEVYNVFHMKLSCLWLISKYMYYYHILI